MIQIEKIGIDKKGYFKAISEDKEAGMISFYLKKEGVFIIEHTKVKKEFQDKNYWALILGGSSGLGVATAKKLAKHGMNICIIHRNSRSQDDEINSEFDKIRAENIQFKSFNVDAFKSEKRELIVSE